MSNIVNLGAIQPLEQYVQPLRPEFDPYNPNFDRRKLLACYAEESARATLELLEEAGRRGTDIVATSEDMTGLCLFAFDLDHPDLLDALAEPIPGPMTERVAQIARKYQMYIVVCLIEKYGEHFYNTAALLDRNGELVGKYHKVHLTSVEAWRITPGETYPVFETDFGRVGMLICYDLWFPESATLLALNGAEIIFNPTMGFGPGEGPGMARLQTRALDNFVYLVVSKTAYNGSLTQYYPGRSSIVSPWGHIIASTDYRANQVVTAAVDLDEKRVNDGYLVPTRVTNDGWIPNMLNRRPETYAELCSSQPAALTRLGDLPLLTSDQQQEMYIEHLRPWRLKA